MKFNEKSVYAKISMMNFLYVGLGGALGAMFRYAISLFPVKVEFPILTSVTNVLGAIFIGLIIGIAYRKEEMSQGMVLFLKVGICGGFTTFSTFSLEMFNLIEKGKIGMGILYAVLTVSFCIVGVYLGQIIANRVV